MEQTPVTPPQNEDAPISSPPPVSVPPPDTTPQPRKIPIIPIIVGLLAVVGAAGAGIFYFLNTQDSTTTDTAVQRSFQLPETAVPTAAPAHAENATPKQQSPDTSRNIDDVMRGIMAGHIPETEPVGRTYNGVEIHAYRVSDAAEGRYQKLRDYFGISEFPSTEGLTLTNADWRGFSYTEASDVYTKDGYICEVMQPSQVTADPGMICAYALDFSKNTYDRVATFMLSILNGAGINCTPQTCNITEESSYRFPLDMFGRDVVYFDKSVSPDDPGLIQQVRKEANESVTLLRNAGWDTELEDYTDTERSWSKDTRISLVVHAENHYFTCKHTITVVDPGKREMVECSYKSDVLGEVQQFYNPYR